MSGDTVEAGQFRRRPDGSVVYVIGADPDGHNWWCRRRLGAVVVAWPGLDVAAWPLVDGWDHHG